MVLLLSTLLLVGPQPEQKPRLKTSVFPPMQTADIARGCSNVLLRVELLGPETEEWYCPKVEWLHPDGTRSVEESDCPPFEEREEYPRIWRHGVCAPAHPYGAMWEVQVRLTKGKKSMHDYIRFLVK